MAESMSIQAILSAVDSGFSSTMKNAEQAMSGFNSMSDQTSKQNKGFMSSVKSIATGIGVYKLASAGLGAISSGFGNVVGEMTESNIAWQTFDGNMQMLGNSPQQIGKVQKSLQDFATASIYSASDMATTYAQMAALGVDNTEQLVKGMGGLAASAENPQQAMKTLSQQMVQALAKPEMQWADFKLMMEQAPSAMAQVAKHMGMSLDDLILGIQDGEIASKDFAQAVAEVGTNEQFSKLATTYKSTGQALDGMSETLANKLMPAFKALDKIGIKAVEGLTNMIDKIDIEGMVEGFTRVAKIVAPAFREIGKQIGKVSDQVKQFFEPVTKGFGEIGEAVKTFGSDMLLAASYIGLGEWGKAWDVVKTSAIQAFDSITSSFGDMVSGMWSNLKELGSNIGNFINDIDWGSIYDSLEGFFGHIGEQIMSVDWKLVGGEIGGSINELVGGVKNWLDANVPKVIEYAQTVLFNPQSELNIEAGAFHDEVMGLIDGFVEGLGIEEIIHDFIVEMNAKPMFSWGSWEDEISSALNKMRQDMLTLVQGIQNFGNELDQVEVNQEVVMDIMLRRGEGWDESQIKTWIDETYGEGTYDTIIELVPTLEITEPGVSYSDSIQGWVDANAKDVTVEPTVNVNPNLVLQSGHSGGASMAGQVGLSGQIQSMVQSMVPKTPVAMSIPIAPQLTTGGAGAEGEGGIDLSGITSQITSQLESLKATVSSALDGITSTITSQASSWGTSISSAMTTMVTSVTATMTAMTLAVTLGMTAMTLAVSMAMTSLSQSVTTTMTSMAEAVAQAMTSMAQAVTQAMNALVEAVTSGMSSAVSAVQSSVNSIISAVSGLYGPMYSAGQMAGRGLADGLNSMRGAVQAAASALASAANSAARLAFDINSPSKVWREFGYSDGEGLVQGLDGSRRAVKKSATRLAVAGLPSLKPFSGRSSHVSVSGNVSTTQQNEDMKSELSQIKKAINSGQVIMLDSGALVGGTVNQMDSALGEQITMGGRHSLA